MSEMYRFYDSDGSLLYLGIAWPADQPIERQVRRP